MGKNSAVSVGMHLKASDWHWKITLDVWNEIPTILYDFYLIKYNVIFEKGL